MQSHESNRRSVLLAAAGVAGAGIAGVGATPAAARTVAPRLIPAVYKWAPPPPQAPVKEGVAELGDVSLYYWDTGGPGQPIVLLHPATGSAAVWSYQQPVFAKAGYRVVSYSRRGYLKSGNGPKDNPASGISDLHRLADHLGLGRFHLVGSAAGGFLVPDYALSHPERLRSAVIASSLGGVTDPEFQKVSDKLASKEFRAMPASFREVGPSYRAAYPEGVEAWEALEHVSRSGPIISQPAENDLQWSAIAKIRTPTLILTGDCDLFMPPSRAKAFAERMPNAELVTVAEAGHSLYWEQPAAFNSAVLDFVRRHG